MIESPIWRDSRLSAKSKGIWAYMKSKPIGWDFASSRMASEFTDGKKAIQGALRELEGRGYLNSTKLSTGRVHYSITDNPWVGVEPTIQKSPLAKYNVILEFPQKPIGGSMTDAIEAVMLAYGTYQVTREEAIAAIDGRSFSSYADIISWMDTDKDNIDERLNLPIATNF